MSTSSIGKSRKKLKLKPEETRCEKCGQIIKDEFALIVTQGQVHQIIDNTNALLKGVFWLFHVDWTESKAITLVKLVLRQKKNKTLHVDAWWEGEYIVSAIASTEKTLDIVKAFWRDHPTDTFSKQAKLFVRELQGDDSK